MPRKGVLPAHRLRIPNRGVGGLLHPQLCCFFQQSLAVRDDNPPARQIKMQLTHVCLQVYASLFLSDRHKSGHNTSVQAWTIGTGMYGATFPTCSFTLDENPNELMDQERRHVPLYIPGLSGTTLVRDATATPETSPQAR